MENQEPNEELMFRASLIERHLQELSEKFEYLSQQLSELEEFKNNLKFLKDAEAKEIFATLGRGVYVKSKSDSKDLFVNVGAGVIVKKTPEETAEIIGKQIKNFHEAKAEIMTQIEAYKSILDQTISVMHQEKKN